MCSTLFICKKVKVVDTDLCQLLHSQPAYSLMCCSDINQNMCTQTWLSRSYIYIIPNVFLLWIMPCQRWNLRRHLAVSHQSFSIDVAVTSKMVILWPWFDLRKWVCFCLPNLGVTWFEPKNTWYQLWIYEHHVPHWKWQFGTHPPLLFTFGQYIKPGYVDDFSYNLQSGSFDCSLPLRISVRHSKWARLRQVFSMTLRKADGAELGLNVKALDSQKAGTDGDGPLKGPWWTQMNLSEILVVSHCEWHVEILMK
jgi:hypothetical protein